MSWDFVPVGYQSGKKLANFFWILTQRVLLSWGKKGKQTPGGKKGKRIRVGSHLNGFCIMIMTVHCHMQYRELHHCVTIWADKIQCCSEPVLFLTLLCKHHVDTHKQPVWITPVLLQSCQWQRVNSYVITMAVPKPALKVSPWRGYEFTTVTYVGHHGITIVVANGRNIFISAWKQASLASLSLVEVSWISVNN